MSTEVDPHSLARAVVAGGFALGLALGAIGQATRFCVRGAIADWVIFRGPARMVAWVVAIATAAVALQALLAKRSAEEAHAKTLEAEVVSAEAKLSEARQNLAELENRSASVKSDLAALESQLAGISRTTLHWADALTLDPATLDPAPTKLVANLPYNIATPLLVESLDRLPTVVAWCVMVQREVADRLFADPGTKAYGAVSVLVGLVTARTGFHPVSREVFRPRPNVDSALVAFRRLAPGVPPGVKRVVAGAFAHRRKTLANSLELAGVASREDAAAALASIGRDASVRAEALAPPEFVGLARALP